MRSRKRVISLVLGLVLILGSAVGPFAMGALADPVELTAAVNSITDENYSSPDVISLSGTISGTIEKEDENAGVEIALTYKRQNQADSTGSETIIGSGTVTVVESGNSHTFTASVTVGVSERGNTYKLESISLSNAGSPNITISGESVITVAPLTPPTTGDPTITSVTIDDKSSDISYPENYTEKVKVKAVITGGSECNVVAKIQKKEGEGLFELSEEFNNKTLSKQPGEGNEYAGDISIPTEAGDYALFVEGTYKTAPELPGETNLEAKRIDFTITSRQSGDSAKPSMTVNFNSTQSNRVFKQDENVSLSVTFGDGELAKISSVNYTIKKGGNTVTDHNNVSLTKGTTGFSREITIPSIIGEDYTLEVSAVSVEGTPNPDSPTPIQFSVVSKASENPHSIVFTSVKFSDNAQEIGSIAPGRELNFSAVITSSHEITNAQAIVFNASGNGVGNPVILTKGTDNLYTGKITTPENEGFYGITLSATANGETVNNTALSFNVVRDSSVDSILRLKRELSSNSLVGNSSGQIFTEGGTVKFTITSENPNVRFTNSKIVAWITTNSDTPKTSVTLNKITTGTYANRRYEGTFTAGVPLASDFYYTITNEAFPYTITGGTDGTATEFPVAYTTASNKPYIRSGNLNATYYSSANSNIGVSPGSLIEGNVITYQAQLDNYSGVNSVNIEFTNRSGMTGYNINIPLSKVNNTGLFRGSYTVTRNNTGFTYDLSKITYKTSSGSVSYDMDNYPTYGHAFTISNHQHTFGGTYSYNSEEHWQNSTCNAEHPGQIITGNRAKHTYTSTIVTSATQTTSGTRKYTCTVCGYTYNATIPATGTALSTTTLDIIRNMSNGTRAIVTFNSDYVVSSDIFSALKGTTKEIEFQNRNKVSWIFRGQDITGTAKAININTEISSVQSNTSPYASYIRNLVGKQPTVIIDFAANGNLPGRATVRVPLSTAMLNALGNNRTGLKVQYYNATANRLEDIATNVNVYGSGSDSYVEFAITHNSSYIITKEGGQNVGGSTTGNGNGNTNSNTNSGNTNANSGNKKPTSTTVTTVQKVIHKVSPKTLDGGYGMIWISMFMVGVLLVISSLCMTKFEE